MTTHPFPTNQQTLLKWVLAAWLLFPLLLSMYQQVLEHLRPVYKVLCIITAITDWVSSLTGFSLDLFQVAAFVLSHHGFLETMCQELSTNYGPELFVSQFPGSPDEFGSVKSGTYDFGNFLSLTPSF